MGRTSPTSDPARVRLGIGLISALAVSALAVFFLDTALRATMEGTRITVLAESAGGLRPGSPVWVAGRPVGRVLSIELRPPNQGTESVVIRATLDRRAVPALRVDAHAEVTASDLMAPVVVSIDPGTGIAPPWDYADTLRALGQVLDQDAVLAMADTLVISARRLEARAREAQDALTDGSGSIQLLRSHPDVVEGIERELALLRSLLTERLPGSSLARLAADTIVGPSTRRVRDRFETWNASPERETTRRSLETAVRALEGMGARLEVLLTGLQRGEGTAGRALMDAEIERQLEGLRIAIAKLADQLAHDPSSWLRVRVF